MDVKQHAQSARRHTFAVAVAWSLVDSFGSRELSQATGSQRGTWRLTSASYLYHIITTPDKRAIPRC